MKKRLAMIVTMLMVTVSMAACGGKKDTTADKESVINTEATEEVAETEEPETEEVEAATETEEPETEAAAEQETTGKLESNTSSAENTAAQPSDNNTSKSNKTPILLTIVQLRHMSIPGCCMKAAVIMRHRLLKKPGTSRYMRCRLEIFAISVEQI